MDVDWMHLAYDTDQWRTVVNTVMKLRVPYSARNIFTIWATITFWRTLAPCSWLLNQTVTCHHHHAPRQIAIIFRWPFGSGYIRKRTQLLRKQWKLWAVSFCHCQTGFIASPLLEVDSLHPVCKPVVCKLRAATMFKYYE